MHLSEIYWLLVLLRPPCPKVYPLRLDDSTALHEMQNQIDSDERLHRLCALAGQGIDWIKYGQGTMVSEDRLVSLEKVVGAADIVCGSGRLHEPS